MILSVLICTLPQRREMFESLYGVLLLQIANCNAMDKVEVIWDSSAACTTGKKRNHLLTLSKGKYVVFIDDDDEIVENYIELILAALEQHPNVDCVGMRGYVTFDGQRRKDWSISIHHKYWHETPHEYCRTPNHISPVKREIAILAKFPEITYGEDIEYSKRIYPHLQTETFINEYLYHYKFIENK